MLAGLHNHIQSLGHMGDVHGLWAHLNGQVDRTDSDEEFFEELSMLRQGELDDARKVQERREREEVERIRCEEAAEAARLLLRNAAAEVRTVIAARLGDDLAQKIQLLLAGTRIQAAARGLLVRRKRGLRLQVVSDNGEVFYFRMNLRTKLAKIMCAFCQRHLQGARVASVRFLFDGARLNEWETPAGFDMEDGDVIDAMYTA